MFWKNICFLVLGCGIASVASASNKKMIPCALDDIACTTRTADSLYKTVMIGNKDINVPSSDPVHLNRISARVDNMNYTFTDADMYGFSKCNVKSHSINVYQLSWTLLLDCPQIILNSNYELSGSIGGAPIEGKGRSNIVHDKYQIGLHGGFEYTVDSKGRPHMHLISFEFHRLEVVGNIKSEYSNLYNGDVAKSEAMHKYLNDNWKAISYYTLYPTIRGFGKKTIENINAYLTAIPANELFFKDE